MKPTVLILSSITSLRENIKYALRTLEMDFFQYHDLIELMAHLESKNKEDHPLIFIDMDSHSENRLEEMKKVQGKYGNIPILALTGDSKKEKILSLIMGGASEIIIKPFSEKILIEKTKKMMGKKQKFTTERIHMDFPGLLRRELFKGQKGKYSLSIMIATFYKPKTLQDANIESEYYSSSHLIKEGIEELLFETDHFLQYGNQTFVGILPFCDQQKKKIVEEKVKTRFEELKQEHIKMKDYQLKTNFVTYPEEGEDAIELTEKLTQGLQNKIEEVERFD